MQKPKELISSLTAKLRIEPGRSKAFLCRKSLLCHTRGSRRSGDSLNVC
jgi:hypothetical protein